MSRLKLDTPYSFGFDLMGIVCTDRGYKMAWRLNRLLGLHLVRHPEIDLELVQGSCLKLQAFEFHTEHDSYRLIKNRGMGYASAREPLLLPEAKEFDYFLRVDNQTGSIDMKYIEGLVRQLPTVEYCAAIEPNRLKHRENLLF